MRDLFWFVLVVVTGVGLSACGGPPPISEIEANLQAPSATLSTVVIKNSYNNYTHGKLAVTMPGLSQYGKMASFFTAEGAKTTSYVPMKRYLLQSGVPAKMADLIAPHLPVNDDWSLRKMESNKGRFGVIRQAFNPQCVEQRLNVGFLGGGSFHYIIDLGCEGIGSGVIELKAEVRGGANSGELSFQTNFLNACIKSNYCLNGSLVYKFAGSAGSQSVSGSMIVSMLLRVTTPSGESAEVKQGMRISFNSARKAGTLEALVYVKDAEGNTGTAVLEVSASGEQGSFAIRGSNGRFVCKTTDSGKSGQCFAENAQGSATYSW